MQSPSLRVVVGIGVAFGLGVWTGRVGMESDSSDPAGQTTGRTAQEKPFRTNDTSAAHGRETRMGAPVQPAYQSASRLLTDEAWQEVQSASPAERHAALRQKSIEVLAAVSDSDRLRQFSALMEFLQPGDYAVVLEAFAHHDKSGRSSFHDEFKMLSLRAVTVGDDAPIRKLTGDYAKDQTIHLWFEPVVKAWALNHTKEAVGWWNETPDEGLREKIAESLISGLAQGDPKLGWEYAKLFSPEQQQSFAGRFFDNALMSGGVNQAMDWIRSVDALGVPDAEAMKRDSLEKLRHSLWATSTEKASKTLTPLASEPFAEAALVKHVTDRAPKDPTQVAGWVETLKGTPHFEVLRSKLLETWPTHDAAAAQAWAAKLQ